MCNDSNTFVYTVEMQQAHGAKMANAKADAYYENLCDVHWEDLEFYLEKARRDKDNESFNIAIKILNALHRQVIERK